MLSRDSPLGDGWVDENIGDRDERRLFVEEREAEDLALSFNTPALLVSDLLG